MPFGFRASVKEMLMIALTVLVWLGCAALSGFIAKEKGADVVLYTMLGLCLGVLGPVIAAFAKPEAPMED